MEKTLVEHSDGLVSVHLTNPLEHGQAPMILLFPAFEGHSEFIMTYGARLVDQGFQVLIADMYGAGKHLLELDDCLQEIQPLLADRALVRARAQANLEVACELAEAEEYELGTMGFCFGGMCALELARSGCNIPAVFAAHASLAKAAELTTSVSPITNIMLAQGYADPLVNNSELEDFAQEMTSNKWSCVFYGNTKHSFTDQNVGAMDPERELAMGREYNPLAAQQCFQQAVLFFENHLC